MLDFVSHGAQEHGPVHLLLTSAGELGFAGDGDERRWVRASLPLLRIMTGPVQHFYSSILEARQFRISAQLAETQGVQVLILLMLGALCNYLPLVTPGHDCLCPYKYEDMEQLSDRKLMTPSGMG